MSSPDIVITNYGEKVFINEISESDEHNVLNSVGMTNWFPLPFDSQGEIHIPLNIPLNRVLDKRVTLRILIENRLGTKYQTIITIENGKPSINTVK